MSVFISIASVQDVPEDGRFRCFEVHPGRRVALARDRGRIVATDPECPHQWASLEEEGQIEEGELICFRHGWSFDPRTGECEAGPSFTLTIHPVRLEGERIYVSVPTENRLPDPPGNP